MQKPFVILSPIAYLFKQRSLLQRNIDRRRLRRSLFAVHSALHVRAIVFTSDSLSLIFNKPMRGREQINLAIGMRRGASDRFVFAFDSLTSSTDLRRQIDRSRRCGQQRYPRLFIQAINI